MTCLAAGTGSLGHDVAGATKESCCITELILKGQNVSVAVSKSFGTVCRLIFSKMWCADSHVEVRTLVSDEPAVCMFSGCSQNSWRKTEDTCYTSKTLIAKTQEKNENDIEILLTMRSKVRAALWISSVDCIWLAVGHTCPVASPLLQTASHPSPSGPLESEKRRAGYCQRLNAVLHHSLFFLVCAKTRGFKLNLLGWDYKYLKAFTLWSLKYPLYGEQLLHVSLKATL